MIGQIIRDLSRLLQTDRQRDPQTHKQTAKRTSLPELKIMASNKQALQGQASAPSPNLLKVKEMFNRKSGSFGQKSIVSPWIKF